MKRTSRRDRRRARAELGLILCALVMLASLAYMFHYDHTRREILRDNARFSSLYAAPELIPAATDVPPTAAPTPSPTVTPTAAPTAAPTATATPSPATSSTATPSPTAAPTATPTPAPSPSPSPEPTFAVAVDATRAPRGTADADTYVVALPTPPPVQESFSELLAANPEAVGFLTIDDVLSLPVAQRPNDNDYYLAHSFDGAESIGGTLFLDGANLLVPEDDCLIVYGHNMKNGTMFRPLIDYEQLSFLREHPLIRFDTLYENRVWAPFAALTATAEPDSERYLNLRQFRFDEPGFELFVRSLRALSVWNSPVEVDYGDKLLLLVTCEYTHDNGRFVLALRAARADESWDQLLAQVQASK